MIRRFLAFAGCLAMLGLACGDDANDPADTVTAVITQPAGAPCSPRRPFDSGDSTRAITSGGIERTYLLHIPPTYDGTTAMPLVVAFHGLGQTPADIRELSGLDAAADEFGVILAYPGGTGAEPGWNIGQFAGAPDDVAFTDDLLDELEAKLCIDSERVYAAGFSNGGGMALKLGCNAPERFAAVGAIAGIFSSCAVPLPLIAFHGTSDMAVPFEGGPVPGQESVAFPPIRRAVSESARAIGCDGLPVISRPGTEIEISTFVNCPAGDGETLLYTVLGGGHTWPGSPAPLAPETAGVTTQQVDASAEMLEFFLAHRQVR